MKKQHFIKFFDKKSSYYLIIQLYYKIIIKLYHTIASSKELHLIKVYLTK